MSKLKFAVLLPILQLLIAVILLQWGYREHGRRGLDTPYGSTATMVCHGLNAPALLLRALALLLPVAMATRVPTLQFGFGLDEIFFLVGVGVLWSLVGGVLDRSRAPKTSKSASNLWLNMFYVVLFVWGGCLMYSAVQALRSPGKWNNPAGNVTEGVLFAIWSLLFISISARRLIRGPGSEHAPLNRLSQN
jgi:hypothetical protein